VTARQISWAPSVAMNRFEYACAIVKEVNSPLVGMTLDQFRFNAMVSSWDALEKADPRPSRGCLWYHQCERSTPSG